MINSDISSPSGEYDAPETLLLVDDNPTNLQVLAKILEPLGHTLLFARTGERALSVLQNIRPALILLDVMMPGIDGFEVCLQIKQNKATEECTVIFLSALSDVDSKVCGFEVGGADFITKPFHAEEVLARVRTHLSLHQLQRQLKKKNLALQHELEVAGYMMEEAQRRVAGPLRGHSLMVQALRQSITRVAAVTTPLLLTGAAGTNFEAIARSVHNKSPRWNRPFIRLNAQALVGQQGYTFALSRGQADDEHNEEQETREGLLWLAHQGTLYVEQVEALPTQAQRELIQTFVALETARAEGQTPRPDVRLIVASTKEPQALTQSLPWNPDWADLLQSCHIAIPALSQRREDVPDLANFYLEQYARQVGKVVAGFSQDSLDSLQAYHWPGDIRELQNVVEREVALASDAVIQLDPSVLREGRGVVLGGYQLLDKLGQGGMGEVWRAKHQWLKRPAAVKLIRFQPDMEEEAKHQVLQRFQKEAQVTAQLTSPFTVNLYDFGLDQTGVLYYAMELLTGIDMQNLVERFGPMPAERVGVLLQPICRSLAEAHHLGLVHRDIKPSNIFLCRLGLEVDYPKLLDFGVVKDMLVQTLQSEQLAGHVCGTPGYMSPEQIEGKDISPHTDIYALGCVAYWCLTGRGVFEANDPVSLLMRHLSERPAPPSRFSPLPIPPEFDRLLLSCLAVNPEHRPSALELYQELQRIPWDDLWTQDRAVTWWQLNQPELSLGLGGSDEGQPTIPLKPAPHLEFAHESK